MIALDTNILIRLLVADDDDQYLRVERLLDVLEQSGEEALITDITLAETSWVLKTGYKASKSEIVHALEAVRNTLGFKVISPISFERALNSFRNGRGGFADYLLREQALDAGCRAIATFDRRLLQEDLFFSPD
ncbi:MAG: type II toxin-antitoxin system VapC family toxin [Calditrichaeota bacterium]|nr:type II toxin-antitoxin system VapC family toxin [Calditrichota bacterium]